MLLAALAMTFAIDAVVADKLAAGFSGEREQGAYALARLYDPSLRADRELVDGAFNASSGGERASLLRGIADRDFGADRPVSLDARIATALADPDPAVRIAAVECLERMPFDRERPRVIAAFSDARTSLEGAHVMRALFVLVERNPDPAWKDSVEQGAAWLFGQSLSGAHPALDANSASALAALAAEGRDTVALLPPEERAAGRKDAKPDYWRTARANAIRAAGGDVVALSALVEVARTAAEPALRREATALATQLPPEPRAKALAALSTGLDDFDGLLRTTLIRALVRDGVAPLLAKAARDPFPELRFTAVAALADLNGAGPIPEADTDPLVRAALARAHTRRDAATPIPSPSPSPAASPSPSASPPALPAETPFLEPAATAPTAAPKPFPYPKGPPTNRPH